MKYGVRYTEATTGKVVSVDFFNRLIRDSAYYHLLSKVGLIAPDTIIEMYQGA